MRLRLIAVGTKMPDWVARGFREYAGRMPRELPLELREVQSGGRGKGGDPARAEAIEARRLLEAAGRGARVVALDERGRGETTEQLARRMGDWLQEGRDVALLVGGADGLGAACNEAAEYRWSLSPLTLPHMLVRVVVAEQLYRAWSILNNHPYHRQG